MTQAEKVVRNKEVVHIKKISDPVSSYTGMKHSHTKYKLKEKEKELQYLRYHGNPETQCREALGNNRGPRNRWETTL